MASLDFAAVIDGLLHGDRFRRPDWPERSYVVCMRDEIRFHYRQEARPMLTVSAYPPYDVPALRHGYIKPGMYRVNNHCFEQYVPTQDDMMSKDWEHTHA